MKKAWLCIQIPVHIKSVTHLHIDIAV